MNDVTKLPKWAQTLIARQSAHIEDLDRQVSALLGKQEFENVESVIRPVYPGPYVPVTGDYRRGVCFLLSGQDPQSPHRGRYVEVQRSRDGRLELSTDGVLIVRAMGGVNRLEIDVEE